MNSIILCYCRRDFQMGYILCQVFCMPNFAAIYPLLCHASLLFALSLIHTFITIVLSFINHTSFSNLMLAISLLPFTLIFPHILRCLFCTSFAYFKIMFFSLFLSPNSDRKFYEYKSMLWFYIFICARVRSIFKLRKTLHLRYSVLCCRFSSLLLIGKLWEVSLLKYLWK